MPLLLIILIYSIYLSCANFFYYDIVQDIESEVLKMNIVYLLLSFIYLFVKRRKNIFCPELILSITFYCATYLLSFATYLEYTGYYIFTGRLLLQAISLATLGWTFFIIGALLASTQSPKYEKVTTLSYKYLEKNRNIFIVIGIFFFSVVLLFDLPYYFSIYTDSRMVNESASDGLFFLISALLIAGYHEFYRLYKINVSRFFLFLKTVDKKYFVLFIIVLALLLLVGDRSSALQILLPFVFLYAKFIHKLEFKLIMIGAICFVLLFVFVGNNRGQSKTNDNFEYFNVAQLTSDFMPANAAIPVMINYTDKQGYAMGKNMIYQIFSVVPFLQGFMKATFDVESVEPSSIVNSKEILGDNYWSGQGTNVVADLFYSFGVLGVIVGMALAGYIYSLLFNRIVLYNITNNYQTLMYLVLFGNIIYFCRVEYTYILRSLSFTLLLTYIISLSLRIK